MSAPQLKVVPGRHHDPNEPWAREPRLRSVVELGSRRPLRRGHGKEVALRYLIFAAGVLLGAFLGR